jgi:hypothetical protein
LLNISFRDENIQAMGRAVEVQQVDIPWYIMNMLIVCSSSSYIVCLSDQILYNEFKLLKSKIYFTYSQFNIQQFYVLPTQCIYVFCLNLRTNSDYFPMQH